MLRYQPDWEVLRETRQRLISRGLTESEAESDICAALRDGKIPYRRTVKLGTVDRYRLGHLRARGNLGELRLLVPRNLAPADIDWVNSCPKEPWLDTWGFRLPMAKLELSTKHAKRVLCPKAPEESEASLDPSLAVPVVAATPPTKGTNGEETRATRALVAELKIREMRKADVRRFLSDQGYSLGNRDRPFERVWKNARSQANKPAKRGRPPKSSH